MNTINKLYEVLYVSTLAPDQPLGIVGCIARHARIANAMSDITGVLIFDGMRFCQQLEGSQKTVLALMERLYNDPRHTAVEVFHHGPLAKRRFKHFSVAFADVDDIMVLEQLERLEGQAGVDTFMKLVSTLEPQA